MATNVDSKKGVSTITVVENVTRKYGARTVPFILLFLCASTVFAPALAQFQLHLPVCPVKFDKDSYRPGETVTMYGTVVDSGKPVEGANIAVDLKAFGLDSLEAKTDSNGNWTLSFEVPDDQELGTWPVEVSVAYGSGTMSYGLMIQVGEVEEEDDVEPVENEVEPLKERIAELEAENQMLQGRIQELEDAIQILQETSSGVSYGTLGIVVSGVVVICLAVFAIIYQRSSQRRIRQAL